MRWLWYGMWAVNEASQNSTLSEHTRAGFLTFFPNSLRIVFLPFWVSVFMHTLTGSRAQLIGLFQLNTCSNLFIIWICMHNDSVNAILPEMSKPKYICPPKMHWNKSAWRCQKSKHEMLSLNAFRGLKCCQQRHRTLKMSQREGHTNKTELKRKVMQQFGQHETQ